MNITRAHLAESRLDSNTSLIPFIDKLRTPGHRVKLHELNNIFDNSLLWVSAPVGGSGHKKFVHTVTKVVVEYQSHIRGKENIIKLKIQDQILEQVQKHLNILHNDIFYGEKDIDYNKALEKYMELNELNDYKALPKNIKPLKQKNNNKPQRR